MYKNASRRTGGMTHAGSNVTAIRSFTTQAEAIARRMMKSRGTSECESFLLKRARDLSRISLRHFSWEEPQAHRYSQAERRL